MNKFFGNVEDLVNSFISIKEKFAFKWATIYLVLSLLVGVYFHYKQKNSSRKEIDFKEGSQPDQSLTDPLIQNGDSNESEDGDNKYRTHKMVGAYVLVMALVVGMVYEYNTLLIRPTIVVISAPGQMILPWST